MREMNTLFIIAAVAVAIYLLCRAPRAPLSPANPLGWNGGDPGHVFGGTVYKGCAL